MSKKELQGIWIKPLVFMMPVQKVFDLEIKEDGIENIIKHGIAFSGKKAVIKAK